MNFTINFFYNLRLFLGTLYKVNPSESSLEIIASKMLTLTVDPNPKVRACAVSCLGKLYD